MFVLVTGGAASGKSAFAESLTANSGYSNKIYVATMRPFDDESVSRIEKHHILRKGKGFSTAEIYNLLFSKDGLKESEVTQSTVLLECMANYLNNNLFDINGIVEDTEKAEEIMRNDIFELVKLCPNLIIVTNEVFSDGIEYLPETLKYIEILGRLNIFLAELADEVYEVVCGISLSVKRVSK